MMQRHQFTLYPLLLALCCSDAFGAAAISVSSFQEAGAMGDEKDLAELRRNYEELRSISLAVSQQLDAAEIELAAERSKVQSLTFVVQSNKSSNTSYERRITSIEEQYQGQVGLLQEANKEMSLKLQGITEVYARDEEELAEMRLALESSQKNLESALKTIGVKSHELSQKNQSIKDLEFEKLDLLSRITQNQDTITQLSTSEQQARESLRQLNRDFHANQIALTEAQSRLDASERELLTAASIVQDKNDRLDSLTIALSAAIVENTRTQEISGSVKTPSRYRPSQLQITPHRSSNLSALQARSEEEDRILDLETRLKSALHEKEAAEARVVEALAESAQAKIAAEDSKRAIDATKDALEATRKVLEAQRIAIEEERAKELTALAAQIPEEVLIIERAVAEAGNIAPESELGATTFDARPSSEAPSNPNLQKMTSNDLIAPYASNVTIAENIESQLSPQDHAKKHFEHSHHLSNSIISSAHQSSSVISSHVDARVISSDIEGLSAGDETIDKHFWIKGFGSDTKQKSSGSISAFKSQQRGMIMGADVGLMDDYLILGFAYTKGFWKSKLQGKLAGDRQKVENDIGAIYARYSLTDKLFAGSQLAYGKTKIKTLHSGNNAKTTGNIFNANLDLGYIITIAGKILFVPKVGLGYNWLKINGFYDYGNGSYISRIGAKESNRLSSNIGFSFKRRYLIKEMNFVPEIHLSIDHMIKSKTNSVQVSIIERGQETSSIVNPINNHKNSYAIGGSLSVYRNDMVRVAAGYDYGFKPGCKSHSGYGRIALKF